MSARGLGRCRGIWTAALAVGACCSFAQAIQAHPHVWATVRSEIVFGPDDHITGIRQAWTFDECGIAAKGLRIDLAQRRYSKDQ